MMRKKPQINTHRSSGNTRFANATLLPVELSNQNNPLASTGLEPATFALLARRSNHLS